MTNTAPALDTLAAALGLTPAVELPGVSVLHRLIRVAALDELRAAVAEAGAKVAKRLPGVIATVHTTEWNRPMLWCATHRTFAEVGDFRCVEGIGSDSPFADRPAACYLAGAEAVDVDVRVKGLPACEGEWVVGGVLTRDAAGAVVATTVGGDDDSARFADVHRHLMGECVHCGVARTRNVTVLLVSELTGEVRPVGRSCLADYTGGSIRVEALATLTGLGERFAQAFAGVLEVTADTAPTVDVVALAARYMALYGKFVRSNEYGREPRDQATAHHVRDALTFGDGRPPAIIPAQLTDADRAAAAADIALMLDADLDDDRDRESDYLANLRAVCSLDWAQITGRRNRVGLLASLPSAAARRREAVTRAALRAEAAEGRINAFIGEQGNRREFTGTVVTSRTVDTDYGTCDLLVLDTAEGRVKAFCKVAGREALEPGMTATILATIKGHETYQDMRQTRVIRVKLAG
jgi:hypothetical protein